MSVLTDVEIIDLINEGMITPFDLDLVQPASLDVRIGLTGKLLTPGKFAENKPNFVDVDLSAYSKDNPYLFHSGDRLLVATLELFNMPNNVCGFVCMRSSAGRNFINHVNAGFIDPRFTNSVLTMEFINDSYSDFPLYPGLSITQIVFYWMSNIPMRNYQSLGNYNNDLQCVSSKKNYHS